MSGTDRMDEDVNSLRIDVSVNNAWILKRKSSEPKTKLEFRREIAQIYLTRYKTQLKSPVEDSVRRLHRKLALQKREIAHNKRRPCANKEGTSCGRTMCKKCDVGLCQMFFKL
ncbi:hypothetical protein J437_LFUL011784 [Ladona fulva]|uniref:Uncharacterized protein n=1 Tax=Ladona fulva TaxID=123851 RepID=A0A8K0KB30_LADFU|nr:hypothetical protein J437_LFUL011784 [Ladona fulva]